MHRLHTNYFITSLLAACFLCQNSVVRFTIAAISYALHCIAPVVEVEDEFLMIGTRLEHYQITSQLGKWKKRLEDHLELLRSWYRCEKPHRVLEFWQEVRTAGHAGLPGMPRPIVTPLLSFYAKRVVPTTEGMEGR